MNYKLAIGLAAAIGLYGCQQEAEQASVSETAKPSRAATAAKTAPQIVELGSGIDKNGFDESVRPQDDFFDYVNGTWLKETEIPADKARWGTFDVLGEQSQKDIRALVEEVSKC
jgi:hypothetical protein